MKNKNIEKTFVEKLKIFMDGEPKNIEPLQTIQNSKLTIYGIKNEKNFIFFDTMIKTIDYIKNNKNEKNTVFTIEYLGYVAGRNDVIRISTKKTKQAMITIKNETTYEIYNKERSFYKGEFVWEENQGNLTHIYKELFNRGIYINNDLYLDKNIKSLSRTR